MKLRRAATFLFAAALSSSPAAAQSGPQRKAAEQAATGDAPRASCQLRQPPRLLGLRLRMSADEVRAVFPRLQLPAPNDLGVAGATLHADDIATGPGASPEFEHVADLALEFTDGRLSYLRLGYPVTMRWTSMDQFVARVADWLDLPGGWKRLYDRDDKSFRDIEDFRDQALECESFRISAGIGVEGLGEQTPHIKLEDTDAARRVSAREDERARRERDAAPQTSKP